jgi:hypothetical protein
VKYIGLLAIPGNILLPPPRKKKCILKYNDAGQKFAGRLHESVKATFASTGLRNQVRERAMVEAARLVQIKNDEAAKKRTEGVHKPGSLLSGKVVPSRLVVNASSVSAGKRSTGPAKSKKIRAYGNGSPIDGKGPEVVVVGTLEALLTSATKRLSLTFGARCLYTAEGKAVTSVDQIVDGMALIVSVKRGFVRPPAVANLCEFWHALRLMPLCLPSASLRLLTFLLYLLTTTFSNS